MKSQRLRRERIPRYLLKDGAIFMANNSTRKECFERGLFGLPYEYADFVLAVKTGMCLFLFDFQERKLYGVFEAASDGAMNIIPDAYNSNSHRKFPAQVRFSTLWHCDPLPEHVFCDAIRENYYAPFKFNFGLSRDQVGRLLILFNKRMLKIPRSPVRGRQRQRGSQIRKCVAVTHPGSLENAESFPESMQESISEKLGTSDAFDHGSSAHLEDYIPLPSVEPEEIEDPSDAFLWSSMSFAEVGECLLKPVIWPSGHHSSEGGEDKKQIDAGTRYLQGGDSNNSKLPSCTSGPRSQVQGLYADSSKNRTSVFLRLSGVGKVMAEERHCHNKVDKPEISVFSRLTSGKAQQTKQKARVSASETKPMAIAEEFTCQNLKRKSSCSVKTEGKGYDHFPSKQQKKRSRKHSGKYSRVTKTSNLLSDVPDFSDGSSVSAINS